MRPSLAIMVLALLIGACAAEAGGVASSPSDHSRAPSPSLASSPSPSTEAEVDWAALPSLEDAVLATAPTDGPLAGRYTSAAAGGLWVPHLNVDGSAAVARFDSATLAELVTIDLGGSPGGFPPDAEATAPGADGVWVTLAYQDAVALVDPATNTESRRIHVEGDPYGIVEDGDSLWITVGFGVGVVRVDIGSGEELLRVTSIPSPIQVAVAFDGVWVADHESGLIYRLDPATGDTVATVEVGGRPGIAIGPDSVWARSQNEGTVSRIDPSTNEVVATVELPTHADDIEVVGDSVWVVGGPNRGSCEGTSYLVRIDAMTNVVDGYMPMTCPTMLTTDGIGLWMGTTLNGEAGFSLYRLDAAWQP